MPDTYTLSFRNFRSLRDVTVDIAPLTVVYGPNGSGKSSLIYGLLTLKNFLTNPGQNIPSLFSYPSISLGGLNEVVHRHSQDMSCITLPRHFRLRRPVLEVYPHVGQIRRESGHRLRSEYTSTRPHLARHLGSRHSCPLRSEPRDLTATCPEGFVDSDGRATRMSGSSSLERRRGLRATRSGMHRKPSTPTSSNL